MTISGTETTRTATISELHRQFVKEKRFLKNVTEKTVSFYNQCLKAFIRGAGDVDPSELNRTLLADCIVKLREEGLSAISCNTYISGINSFLSWLHENGYTETRLKIKELKEEKKLIQTFNEQHIRRIVNWKPKGFNQWRLYALLCLLIDTGVRIEEALTLTRDKVDFDNLLITVRGKGYKERVVPMSLELRKVLWKFSQKHQHDIFFPTRDGGRVGYRNALRAFKSLSESLGIEGVRVSFHTLRHTFAVNYVRNGGNLFYLQKALGHETLQMTRRYTELNSEDLKMMHTKTSLLSRVR